MDKQQIRNKLLEQRSKLDVEFVHNASAQVLKYIQTLSHFFDDKVIALYSSARHEVQTQDLFHYLQSRAQAIVFPRNYNVPERELKFYSVLSLSDLKKGKFGILEPEENPKHEVSISEIDVYFIPGVVFDILGNRIGYGSGYYDRALSCAGHEALKIGLAYDFQVLEKIPWEAHDVAMDKTVTESRIIECKSCSHDTKDFKVRAKGK